jgi:photosystem II stability/assembly factor-like uncharacterized protein
VGQDTATLGVGTVGAAATMSGTTWSIGTLPPSGIYGLDAVSCGSTSACQTASSLIPPDQIGLTVATSDGGTTWTTGLPGGTSGPALDAVSCSSGSDCVVAGGGIFSTTNGGSSWTAATFSGTAPAGTPFYSGVSCATTTSDCVAVGAASEGSTKSALVAYSTDGGTSWTYGTAPDVTSIFAISCASTLDCVAVGSGSVILTSSNGGSTWTSQSVPSGITSLQGVSCASTSNCVAIGVSGASTPAIIATTDGGTGWSAQTVPSGSPLLSGVSCASTSDCLAVGEADILMTNDGGTTWTLQGAPSSAPVLNSVSCPSTTDCVAAGENDLHGGVVIGSSNPFVNVIIQGSPTSGTTTTAASASFTDTLTVSSGYTGPVTFTQVGASVPPGLTVNTSGDLKTTGTLGVGSYTVSGTTADGDGDNGTFTYTLNVTTNPQTIAFTSTASSPTVGGTYTVTTTGGGSGNPVVLTIDGSTAGNCSVTGSTVTFLTVGTCTIDANQAGNGTYAPAPQLQQMVTGVAKGTQAISITSTASSPTVGGTYTVTTTGGGSGNPVVLTIDGSTAGNCSVTGSTVTFDTVGNCTIDANQAGNGNWNTATQVQQTVTGVAKGTQAIVFTSTPPASATAGTTYKVTATGGGSGNPVVFSIDAATSGNCTISGSTVTFLTDGACSIDASQAGNTNYNAGSGQQTVAATPVNGYRLVANEGGIFDFGLHFDGSLAESKLNAPIVGLANAPGPDGYLMAGADGGVFAMGGAEFYGSLGNQSLPSPIAAIAAPPSEDGYWLVAKNGTIYPFGSVATLSSVTLPPGAHIVGMASTTDGQGAWITDQFGDVYAEGDALYEGGMGGKTIAAPIVGIAAATTGQGYILVGSDGGVYNFGTQGFYGAVPGSLAASGHKLVAPIVGIAVTHSGNGYWEVGADGGIFNYGDALFLGSVYSTVPGGRLNGPVVGIQHLGQAPA